jgi:copper chaperone CopZ
MTTRGWWATPILASLLASSCCVIQLALNWFALPCAGFSILTPYRPIWLAWTAISVIRLLRNPTTSNETECCHQPSRRARLCLVILILLLTFSPELVGYWNRQDGIFSITTSDNNPIVHATTLTLALRVVGIRCEACASRVKSTLLALPGVQDCRVDQRSGRVLVTASIDPTHLTTLQDQLITEIERIDGTYQATLTGVYEKPILFSERSW